MFFLKKNSETIFSIKKTDVFSIVESWSSPESNITLPGYRSIVSHGTKGSRKKGRRLGGIIVYIKESFYSRKAIQSININKNYVWIKLDKNAFDVVYDMFMYGLYPA